MRHPVLTRQLKRLGLADGATPGAEVFVELLERIERSYTDADQDRYRLENSLSAASAEMAELYEALRRSSETQLASERNKLQAIIQSLGAGLFLLDRQLIVEAVNPEAERLLGIAADQLVGQPIQLLFEEFHQQEDRPDQACLRQQVCAGATVTIDDTAIRQGSGQMLPVSLVLRPLTQADEVTGAVLVFLDITTRKAAEETLRNAQAELEARVIERTAALAEANRELKTEMQERERAEEILRQSEARFRSLVQNGSDVIAIIERDGQLRYASPSTKRVLGYTPEEGLERNVLHLIHAEDRLRCEAILSSTTSQLEDNIQLEVRVRHADRTWRVIDITVTNLMDDPHIRGFVLNLHDITSRKNLEDQLTHQALYDSLTGLPNRVLFRQRLDVALENARRQKQHIAVIYFDLDHFKTINDSLGHDAGDQLLEILGLRLRDCVRSHDTVARLGGDEFIVLIEHLQQEDQALSVVQRIYDRLQQPVVLKGTEISLSASLGIAINNDSHKSSEELVRDADLAMYAAKARGRACFEIFHPEMNARAQARLELESELRRAIRENELRLLYQPIMCLRTGRLQGVEALVRWQHPRRGFISPADFIPLAEQTGLIIPLGQWVLKEACEQSQRWQQLWPESRLQMSVNLSARQFGQQALVESVSEILASTAVDPTLIKLEITESAAMEDGQVAIATMKELRSLGLQLAIDDFGTGYSSFLYLKQFPLNTLKVDRSFVNGLGQEPENTAIVRAIIALATSLGLNVTGEGVETREQQDILTELGCTYGQGYLFSRPVAAEVISTQLHSAYSDAVETADVQQRKTA